jgi:hypothetical protein
MIAWNNLRFLSLPALATIAALVVGSVVAFPQKASAADTATNLGTVVVDCTAGNLTNRTIAFTGGVGDYFFLLSSGGNCGITDGNGVLSGESASLTPAGAQKITVLSVGTFTVTDAGSNAKTFTVVKQPIFANQGNAPASGQAVEVSCRASSSDYLSNVVYFQSIGNTVTLKNGSGSQGCSSITVVSGSISVPAPALLLPDGSITVTVNGEGTLRIVGQTDGADQAPIYLHFVQGTAGNLDLGTDAHPAATPPGSVTYTDVFLKDGVPINATVTAIAEDNLSSAAFNLDNNENSAGVNWGISTSIDPDGSDGSGTIRLEFTDGAGNPVALSGLAVTIIDIDNLQFVEVNNVKSYELSSIPKTALIVDSFSAGVLSVRSPIERSSDEDEDHWLVMNFAETATLEFTLGSRDGGGSFGILFGSAEFTNPPVVVEDSSATLPDTGVDPSMGPLWLGVLSTGALTLVALGIISVAVSRRSKTNTFSV